MDFSGFEGIINKINGVINCKVVEAEGELSEIHVLAGRGRSPKQIARDIESAIFVSFDYRMDKNKISIAQIGTDESFETMERIKFEGFALKTDDDTVECTVELSHKEEEYSVTETGINTSAGRLKIVAGSTIKAVEKIIGGDAVFDIIDIVVNKNNKTPFVCVFVNMVIKSREEVLLGSTIINNDINESVARATLDAINRRIQKV